MRKLIANLALVIYLKFGGNEMMAALFACRLVTGSTASFDLVPEKLKSAVAKIVIEDCGMPELIPVSFGGTKV